MVTLPVLSIGFGGGAPSPLCSLAASDRSFQFAVGMPQDLDTKGISGFAVGSSHKEVSQVKPSTAEVN